MIQFFIVSNMHLSFFFSNNKSSLFPNLWVKISFLTRNKLEEAADSIGLPTFVVADAGRTQVCFGLTQSYLFVKQPMKFCIQSCMVHIEEIVAFLAVNTEHMKHMNLGKKHEYLLMEYCYFIVTCLQLPCLLYRLT